MSSLAFKIFIVLSTISSLSRLFSALSFLNPSSSLSTISSSHCSLVLTLFLSHHSCQKDFALPLDCLVISTNASWTAICKSLLSDSNKLINGSTASRECVFAKASVIRMRDSIGFRVFKSTSIISLIAFSVPIFPNALAEAVLTASFSLAIKSIIQSNALLSSPAKPNALIREIRTSSFSEFLRISISES